MGTSSAWRRLDRERAAQLVSARVELHWAAQLAAAPGASVLPKRDDFSHTNLGWSRAHEAFVGRPLAGDACAALRPRDLALLVIAGEDVVAERTLAGWTIAQGLRWLSGELAQRYEGPLPALAPPAHDLPEHPVGRGEPFTAEHGAALVELADWFANTFPLLEQIREAAGAGEVRCWPHHFDVATRIERGRERSIGVGMSPGDATEGAPYFYVSPWPYPNARALPELAFPGARWNTEGWVGALLPGTALVPDGAAQHAQALGFFERAIRACDALL